MPQWTASVGRHALERREVEPPTKGAVLRAQVISVTRMNERLKRLRLSALTLMVSEPE
jgi:hypothetical protein